MLHSTVCGTATWICPSLVRRRLACVKLANFAPQISSMSREQLKVVFPCRLFFSVATASSRNAATTCCNTLHALGIAEFEVGDSYGVSTRHVALCGMNATFARIFCYVLYIMLVSHFHLAARAQERAMLLGDRRCGHASWPVRLSMFLQASTQVAA